MDLSPQVNRSSHLLLVDDDPDIHDLVKFMLDSQDIEIASAMNGRQAIEMALGNPPNLILLDYSMPGENGLEVLANLHAAGVSPSIPVVFVTAKESNRILAECFQAGAVDFIRKPFCMQELRARVRSVLDRRRMLSQLEKLALCDPLTELHNRRAIRGRIQTAAEQSDKAHSAVLYLDFDRFKLVNDTLGHDVGDLLLQQIADRLRGTLRAHDSVERAVEVKTAARIGGDEFVVLLENLNGTSDVLVVADRLLTSLAVPYDVSGHSIHCTASIGVVKSLKDYSNPDQILRDADIAMYRAKAAGKARYMVFDPSMRDANQDRLATSRNRRSTDVVTVGES